MVLFAGVHCKFFLPYSRPGTAGGWENGKSWWPMEFCFENPGGGGNFTWNPSFGLGIYALGIGISHTIPGPNFFFAEWFSWHICHYNHSFFFS